MIGYVLYGSEVWVLKRQDHYGDASLWYISAIDTKAIWNRWVPAKDCTLLDPALNVLFMEKENER